MKKVININFQGRILPIEEFAYEILKKYIDSLRDYFKNEEGCDEIINDIECRIAELCDDRLKKGAPCITEVDINLIITSIGRPADFEAQDGFEASSSSNTYSTEDTMGGNYYDNESSDKQQTKKLYRDEHNKVLGGVCSGIANYFNLDPLLVRILWIFLIGVNILGYLILWIAVPSTSVKEVGGVRKRLFRDIENKLIGGVCAGLAKYFSIQVWILRILFLIPFIRFVVNFRHLHLWQFWDAPDFPNLLDITFSPGAVFVYIVLWLVLPEAKTSADKLQMVGEKVDLNSIKNTIQTDLEGFGTRAKSWGSAQRSARREERSARREESSNHPNENKDDNASNNNKSENKGCFHFVGNILTILIKAFVYFILGILIISLLAALFVLGVAGTSLLPLRKFILEDGLQNWYMIGAIILFIWVPVIGIVTAVVRKLAGFKKANTLIRSSFWALWILGWVCIFLFFSSLSKSFSKHNIPVEKTVALANAKLNFLTVTSEPKMKYYEDHWFDITPFEKFTDEDTFYVRNLRIRITQSKTDSFEVKIIKLSNGSTKEEANKLANNINFNIIQKDSILFLDRGIGINKQDKFRNQHVIMTIAVPIGKRIKITKKGWQQFNMNVNGHGFRTERIDDIGFGNDPWDGEWKNSYDDESFSYERGVEYLMTASGLEKIGRMDLENEVGQDDDTSDIEQQLKELKEERQKLEGDLKKSRSEKMKELEKIDRALEQKSNDQKDKKAVTNNTSVIPNLNNVSKVASKFGDLQWVMERFAY
jgi:phage shock protein PspC (stress-responsive transcriptional regulator)